MAGGESSAPNMPQYPSSGPASNGVHPSPSPAPNGLTHQQIPGNRISLRADSHVSSQRRQSQPQSPGLSQPQGASSARPTAQQLKPLLPSPGTQHQQAPLSSQAVSSVNTSSASPTKQSSTGISPPSHAVPSPQSARLPSPHSQAADESKRWSGDARYSELSRLIRESPEPLVRQALRDNWERSLLGSEYHVAFILNAMIHEASSATLERAVADFGDKMLKSCKHLLPRYLETGDLDSAADVLLSKVSDGFLDKALARRFETVPARGLVNMLARAERLGYNLEDVVEEKAASRPENVIPSLPTAPGGRPLLPLSAAAGNPHHQAPEYPHPPQNPQAYVPPPYQPHPQQSSAKQGTAHAQMSAQQPPRPPASSTAGAEPPAQGPFGIVYCPLCSRPCTGQMALTYHLKKWACGKSIDVSRVGKDTCLHCGCLFGSNGGLSYHEKLKVCGVFSGEARTAMHALLQSLGAKGTTPAAAAPGPHEFSTAAKSTASPRTASPEGDKYASLAPEKRRQLQAELSASEEKYGALMREAMKLPEPDQSKELGRLKNSYNTKQSTTRKKYGFKLRERRSKAEIDAERIRLFGTADGPTLSGSSNPPRTFSLAAGVGASKLTPRKDRGSGGFQQMVPVSEMGGLSGSSATAETTDPTAIMTPSRPRQFDQSPSASRGLPAQPPQGTVGASVTAGTRNDPMAIDTDDNDSMGDDGASSTDSDSDDDDIPAHPSVAKPMPAAG